MSEPTTMDLVVGVAGGVSCIYDEALDLRELGRLTIKRASHVEPDEGGNWWADMAPSGGPVLGPFKSRSEALVAERAWLQNGSTTQDLSRRQEDRWRDIEEPSQGNHVPFGHLPLTIEDRRKR